MGDEQVLIREGRSIREHAAVDVGRALFLGFSRLPSLVGDERRGLEIAVDLVVGRQVDVLELLLRRAVGACQRHHVRGVVAFWLGPGEGALVSVADEVDVFWVVGRDVLTRLVACGQDEFGGVRARGDRTVGVEFQVVVGPSHRGLGAHQTRVERGDLEVLSVVVRKRGGPLGATAGFRRAFCDDDLVVAVVVHDVGDRGGGPANHHLVLIVGGNLGRGPEVAFGVLRLGDERDVSLIV